jgi:hypothetical protein
VKFLKVTIDKVDGLNDAEEKVIETNLPESMVLSERLAQILNTAYFTKANLIVFTPSPPPRRQKYTPLANPLASQFNW